MEEISKPEWIASERKFAGRVITVRQDCLQAADGTEMLRDVVEHPGAVVMVPLTAKGNVLLVQQHRHAVDEALIELPAGTIEAGEEPRMTAERELQEEVGFRSDHLTLLGSFYSAPGFCDEVLYCYLAEGLLPSRLDGDLDEAIRVVEMPLAEAITAAATGELRDAKTLSGLLLAGRHLGLL